MNVVARKRDSATGLETPSQERAAARRLAALALTLAAVTTTLRVVEIVHGPPVALANPVRWGLLAASVGISVALSWVIRRRLVSDHTALTLGLAYEVAIGLLVAIAFHATSLANEVHVRGWTPVAVWALLFPLILPAPTRRVVIATLLTAATDPIGLWINVLAGAPMPSAAILGPLFLQTVAVCLIAPVTARIVYRLTIEVKQAREMGSYRLVERLGQGGMGEVWRAEHRMLVRPAALKLIRPELLGSDARSRATATSRFKQEARATAALRSTHTVDVYDFGVTDEGAFFYVMELLDGISLDTLVRRWGPVGPGRAVHLLKQVCHSLGEAHAVGLIHRDVKPANIFTCRLGPDSDYVKVLDFGLVKRMRQSEDSQVTSLGMTVGTPAYIAPEVALGEATFDGRADIYGVGCVAYWLLTGVEVFKEASPMATLLAHVRNEPMPLRDRTDTPIPAALEHLVMRCLAKDPADRPSTAEELGQLLEDAVEPDAWRTEDSRAWWSINSPTPLTARRQVKRVVPLVARADLSRSPQRETAPVRGLPGVSTQSGVREYAR